jgi:hypothetical protein
MSFGVRIFNDAGHAQVSDELMVPQFVGKVTTVDDNIVSQQGAESGFESRSYSGQLPAFGGRDVMIFWTFPAGVWWYPPSVYLTSSASGATAGMFALCAPDAVITGTPVGYVFALGSVISSGEQYAMRLWNAAGALMFDSSVLHLNLHQVASGIALPVDSNHSATLSLPSKPAFLIPIAVRMQEEYDGILNSPDGTAHLKEWVSAISRTSSTVSTRLLLTYDGDYPSSDSSRAGYFEDQTYGNTSGLILPIIDAAIYD